MFERFDGSSRTPRDVQGTILNWVEDNLHKTKVLAIQGPTGIGKSAIAKAIQEQLGGAIVAPNNNLLRQYVHTYPDTNSLQGRKHYHCKKTDIACFDMKALGEKPCPECPYKECRKTALLPDPTIFNPISMFYLTMSPKYSQFDTIIIDEAHTLLSMLDMLAGEDFRHGYYKYPPINDHVDLLRWFDIILKDLNTLAIRYKDAGDPKGQADLESKILKIESVKNCVSKEPENFLIYEEVRSYRSKTDKYLVVKPLETPRHLINQLLGDYSTVILMSATLTKQYVKDLMGSSNFKYLDVPSPIPTENRVLQVTNSGLTAGSKPEVIARWIQHHYEKNGSPNTIVHLTYKMAKLVHEFIPNSITHTPETKQEALTKFKELGGIWLAPAISEGVDLPGDECRLNLIPALPYANYGDPLVKAKLGRPGGRKRYELDVLTTLIQQVGRSTRSVDDRSTAVCGDSRVGKLINAHRSELPKSFVNTLTRG